MKRKIIFALIIVIASVNAAKASLLTGDTVRVDFGYYPPQFVVVEEGISDTITLYSNSFTQPHGTATNNLTLNIDNNVLLFNYSVDNPYSPTTGYGLSFGGGFNTAVSDLDWQPVSKLTNFSASVCEVENWLDSRISFGDDIIGIDFGGLNFVYHQNMGPTQLRIDLMTAPVPLPGALWLFGSGIIGLIAIRGRKK